MVGRRIVSSVMFGCLLVRDHGEGGRLWSFFVWLSFLSFSDLEGGGF